MSLLNGVTLGMLRSRGWTMVTDGAPFQSGMAMQDTVTGKYFVGQWTNDELVWTDAPGLDTPPPGAVVLSRVFQQDSVTEKWFRGQWTNSELVWAGPSDTQPF